MELHRAVYYLSVEEGHYAEFISEHNSREEATLARREYLLANPDIKDRDSVKINKIYLALTDEEVKGLKL